VKGPVSIPSIFSGPEGRRRISAAVKHPRADAVAADKITADVFVEGSSFISPVEDRRRASFPYIRQPLISPQVFMVYDVQSPCIGIQ